MYAVGNNNDYHKIVFTNSGLAITQLAFPLLMSYYI
jgi:hypothetical protein